MGVCLSLIFVCRIALLYFALLFFVLALPLCDRCLEPSRSCRGAQRRRASAGRARPLAATGGLEAHVQLCMWGIAVQEGCKIEEKPTLKYSAKQTTQYIYIYIQLLRIPATVPLQLQSVLCLKSDHQKNMKYRAECPPFFVLTFLVKPGIHTVLLLFYIF